MSEKKIVVLVHGWSVHNTSTYGKFPARLQVEAKKAGGPNLDIRNIWLGKYVSFRDEVQLDDVSRALDAALHRELGTQIQQGKRFIFITHSTGGPVVRDWWDRFYAQKRKTRRCPMSHLIMLAPANFGSALAQLGKSRIGRLKAWSEGVEPGERILDWLEIGSPEAWQLNQSWLDYPDTTSGKNPVFPFVLTGQCIDRALYDQVNTYTGELGSDGVVRATAANLNFSYIKLIQEAPQLISKGKRPTYSAPTLRLSKQQETRRTAFTLVEGRSHAGKDMGILRSIKNNTRPHPTVTAVLDCIRVESAADYRGLCDQFDANTVQIQQKELVEIDDRFLLPDNYFIHDPHSMVIFRIMDDWGNVIEDYDLLFTAGLKSNPNHLPAGFLPDTQRNSRHRGTLTFFLNHALMSGCDEISVNGGKVIREKQLGAKCLGFQVIPHVTEKKNATTHLVHYLESSLKATQNRLNAFLKPHQTTMVDIILRRVVRESVFRLSKDQAHKDFRKDDAGAAIP